MGRGETSGTGTSTSPDLVLDAAAPVTPDDLRNAIGGAPSWSDEALEGIVGVALSHIVPTLKAAYQPDPDTGEYPDWPPDLFDGALLAAMLTFRNRESPAGANTDSGYAAAGFGVPAPTIPPIAWDPRIRHRLAQYVDPGVFVG